MSRCEVCGRSDEEEEQQESSGISMTILHLCDDCRADRQTVRMGAVDREE
jgi:hypothetical protein